MAINRLFQWFAIVLLSGLISGCALTSSVVDHKFTYDLRYDDQDAAVLDYRYGGRSEISVRAPERAVREGTELYANGVTGPMQRGEYLYVKWKNLPTGQIYEDHVDLRSRLPRDITDHVVYFMIRGPQLHIYLVLPERRPADAPAIGPSMYRDRLAVEIYPKTSAL